MDRSQNEREDRDLLIELRTEVRGIREDVKDIKLDTASRLTKVEQEKLDRTEFNRIHAEIMTENADHETRLRDIEKQRWIVGGAATAISMAASFAISIYF